MEYEGLLQAFGQLDMGWSGSHGSGGCRRLCNPASQGASCFEFRDGVVKYAVPLTAFAALTVFLIASLRIDPREIPSPLIDRPAPNFELVRLDQPQTRFSPHDLSGKVWLLNVWASWCVACRAEHWQLLDLAGRAVVPIYGLDYKDRREDGLEMLRELGNPYVFSVEDKDGRVGIDYGVYGVPETYLIDRNGVIRYKRIGPLTSEVIEKQILPIIERLNR